MNPHIQTVADERPVGAPPPASSAHGQYAADDAATQLAFGGSAALDAAPSSLAGTDQRRRAAAEPTVAMSARSSKRRMPAWVWVLLVALAIAVGLGAYMLWGSQRVEEIDGQVIFNGAEMQLRIPAPDARPGSQMRWGDREVAIADGMALFHGTGTAIQPGVNQVAVEVRAPNGDIAPMAVSFRAPFTISLDESGLRADPPTVALVLGADTDVSVRVDGAVQTFDAERATRFEIALPAVASGGTPFEQTVRVSATDGTTLLDELPVHLRIPYTSLVVADPLTSVITTADSVRIAGTTSPGGVVRFGDAAVRMSGERFQHQVALPAVGDYGGTLVSEAPNSVPASRVISIQRVESLRAAASEFGADSSITYSQLRDEPDEHEGTRVRFSGTVYSVRARASYVNVQILTRRCEERRECPLWVRAPRGTELRNGTRIDVYGVASRYQEFRVQGSDGVTRRTSVPRVDAMIVLSASR